MKENTTPAARASERRVTFATPPPQPALVLDPRPVSPFEDVSNAEPSNRWKGKAPVHYYDSKNRDEDEEAASGTRGGGGQEDKAFFDVIFQDYDDIDLDEDDLAADDETAGLLDACLDKELERYFHDGGIGIKTFDTGRALWDPVSEEEGDDAEMAGMVSERWWERI